VEEDADPRQSSSQAWRLPIRGEGHPVGDEPDGEAVGPARKWIYHQRCRRREGSSPARGSTAASQPEYAWMERRAVQFLAVRGSGQSGG